MSKEKETLEQKIREYVQSTYEDELTDLSIKIDKNEGNFNEGQFSYSGHYQTKAMAPRRAFIKFYNKKELEILEDNYENVTSCIETDRKIEEDLSSIPFKIWSENMSIDYKKKNDTEGVSLQSRLIIYAPDIKDKRSKYEEFHIDLMRSMKENGISKSELDMYFVDSETAIESLYTNPQSVISSKHENYDSIIQRWTSIHNNKWYDMVKDHPDKVLKYGKVHEMQ